MTWSKGQDLAGTWQTLIVLETRSPRPIATCAELLKLVTGPAENIKVSASCVMSFAREKDCRKRKMFGFGNKKDKLQAKYQKLMQESFDLSTVNRELSDRKRAEA